MKEVKRFPFPWAFVALTVVVGLVSACDHTGPRLAIAMGDSFISGEGAENLSVVMVRRIMHRANGSLFFKVMEPPLRRFRTNFCSPKAVTRNAITALPDLPVPATRLGVLCTLERWKSVTIWLLS